MAADFIMDGCEHHVAAGTEPSQIPLQMAVSAMWLRGVGGGSSDPIAGGCGRHVAAGTEPRFRAIRALRLRHLSSPGI